VGGAKPAVLK